MIRTRMRCYVSVPPLIRLVRRFFLRCSGETSAPAILRLKPGRRAWVQVGRGSVMLNDSLLRGGDGVAASGEEVLEVKAMDAAELLAFDLT